MVILLIIVVTEILYLLGIFIAPLLGAAGVVGIAVGFSAQSLVKGYFTGFFLLLENQIRVGDVVRIAGEAGLVEEITLRHVRLRSFDGSVLPMRLIDKVTNMSREFSYAVIDVGVAYRENVDEVFAIIRAVGANLRADPDFARSSWTTWSC